MRDTGLAVFGVATLYTVPPHTRFFLWGYHVNAAAQNVALPMGLSLYIQDGLGIHILCVLEGPAGILSLHTQNSFNLMELAAGAVLNVFCAANTTIIATVFGLEVVNAPI